MPEIDQLQIESSVGRILNRWPAVGLATGVIRDGALEFFSGHGVANIEFATPVTQDTVFCIVINEHCLAVCKVNKIRNQLKQMMNGRKARKKSGL